MAEQPRFRHFTLVFVQKNVGRLAVRAPLVCNEHAVVVQRRPRHDATAAPLQGRKALTARSKNGKNPNILVILLNINVLAKSLKTRKFSTEGKSFQNNAKMTSSLLILFKKLTKRQPNSKLQPQPSKMEQLSAHIFYTVYTPT